MVVFLAGLLVVGSTACQTMMLDGVSTALSGASKGGVPKKHKESPRDPMLAITGETDYALVGDFFPTILMAYELIFKANPEHAGLAAMVGSLNVMYANAFVQWPASTISVDKFDEQNAEYKRAKLHYLRGRDDCLVALEKRHKGFSAAVLGQDDNLRAAAISKLTKADVNAAYWACAGWLGAFSLDLLDPDLLGTITSPPAILEKAASLDPDYSGGAIWDLLANFYISAGEFSGVDNPAERAKQCYEEAVRASGGKSPGVYVTYAESFCVPAGDKDGFVDALNKALAIDPNAVPSTRLMTTISQVKAKRLLDNIKELFLDW